MGVMSEEKKVEQDERGTFEAWAKGKFNLKPLPGEGAFFYDKENTQAAWSAWQARAASTSANVAQGAEAFPYQKTFDAIAAATSISGGHVAISVAKFVEAFGAAPPAQTALTDDARECLLDVVSHHHDFRTACIEIKAANETTRSDELYWQKQIDVLDRMKGQAERALTAAQSASASEGT
jgi:hypothetical protein